MRAEGSVSGTCSWACYCSSSALLCPTSGPLLSPSFTAGCLKHTQAYDVLILERMKASPQCPPPGASSSPDSPERSWREAVSVRDCALARGHHQRLRLAHAGQTAFQPCPLHSPLKALTLTTLVTHSPRAFLSFGSHWVPTHLPHLQVLISPQNLAQIPVVMMVFQTIQARNSDPSFKP